jgi:hypothetical protein
MRFPTDLPALMGLQRSVGMKSSRTALVVADPEA